MDGTILNKKYNLVERVKALEEGGGGSIPDYSYTEQKTGRKWLGEDTYIKVVEFGSLPNNTSKRVSSGLSNESIVHIWGTAKYNGDVAPLPSASTNNQYTITLKYDENTHEIIIYTLTDMSIYNANVVIEYTKTEVTKKRSRQKN